MTNLKFSSLAVMIPAVLGLSACGGGGDVSASSASSFPLQAAYMAHIASGAVDPFSGDGDCGGAVITTSKAEPATFHGISGFSTVQSASSVPSGCAETAAVTGTLFYDANFIPLAMTTAAGEYAERPSTLAVPAPLPALVKAGDSGVYATLTTYADDTKAVVTGQTLMTYEVEADSASSVAVTFSIQKLRAPDGTSLDDAPPFLSAAKKLKMVVDGRKPGNPDQASLDGPEYPSGSSKKLKMVVDDVTVGNPDQASLDGTGYSSGSSKKLKMVVDDVTVGKPDQASLDGTEYALTGTTKFKLDVGGVIRNIAQITKYKLGFEGTLSSPDAAQPAK